MAEGQGGDGGGFTIGATTLVLTLTGCSLVENEERFWRKQKNKIFRDVFLILN